jgi:leucyl/phenylalanyl-tRNA--protein transferase
MTLLDVQWQSDHLQSLGVIEVPRARYLELLGDAIMKDAKGAEDGEAQSAKAQRGTL